MTSLTIAGVAKAFDADPVLRGVDLEVDDGTTLALLGPSGSGKSTLLRIVAGLERPDAGCIRLGGDDVTDRPPHQRGVGYVFQEQALFPHLDVAGNVGFGLRMAGVGGPERRRRVGEALDLVGLGGFERRDPATLSGGEAQRVALARALAPRPGVVLLDEPLAALDQLLRERLLLELRALFDRLDVTVVAVTHDPTEAAALGDRIAVLLDGRVAQSGPSGEVVARPATVAVAGLVGQRNVVTGTVVGGGVDTALGRLPVDVGARTGLVSVVVPPAALRPAADGPVHGRVQALLPRGGLVLAVVADAAGDRPPLDVVADPGWRVGDDVRLELDPGLVHVVGG
ncbi:MAG: ABC transporter ATP-binding protein [Acidimicrobiia bacterium]